MADARKREVPERVTAAMWTIGEAHRRARELIIARLDTALFDDTARVTRSTVGLLVESYRALSGDTHTLCADLDRREVFEGQIDRSGGSNLH